MELPNSENRRATASVGVGRPKHYDRPNCPSREQSERSTECSATGYAREATLIRGANSVTPT